ILLYSFQTNGHSEEKIQFPLDYSMWTATQNAIIDATKKIPDEVLQVLTNPEIARIKTKDSIEAKIKSGTPYISHSDYISLANLSRLTKNYAEAITFTKKALEMDPKSVASYALLGLIYKEQKKYKEALNNFEKARGHRPKDLFYYQKLYELYLEIEDYNSAINVLNKALNISPNNTLLLTDLANAYLLDGRFKEAIEHTKNIFSTSGIGIMIDVVEKYPVVRKIVEPSPAHKAGLQVGDRILKINGQSIEGWEKNKIIRDLRGPVGSQIVVTIERKGWDKPKDITVVREIIFDKKVAYALAVRAIALREIGNKEDFIRDAEKAYSINPNDTWARRAMVFALIDKGNFSDALKIIPKDKTDFERLLETVIYARLQDMKKASEVFSQILDEYLITKSAFKQSLINLAQNSLRPYKENKLKNAKEYEARRMFKEALKEYQEYLVIADEKEAKIVRAHIADLIAKHPHLFTLTEEARKFVLRAETFTSEGKFEKAIEEYKKALKFSPFFPALYKALALNYAQLKDYKLAIKNMHYYLDLYPCL
ncbi:MAG: tetratricopeptide repeat protein, partial [Thermodesulfovibrionales bacterium]|nr:tetratricopeptide repeat protein [Thermodesulfovibrionales bacterium]